MIVIIMQKHMICFWLWRTIVMGMQQIMENNICLLILLYIIRHPNKSSNNIDNSLITHEICLTWIPCSILTDSDTIQTNLVWVQSLDFYGLQWLDLVRVISYHKWSPPYCLQTWITVTRLSQSHFLSQIKCSPTAYRRVFLL